MASARFEDRFLIPIATPQAMTKALGAFQRLIRLVNLPRRSNRS